MWQRMSTESPPGATTAVVPGTHAMKPTICEARKLTLENLRLLSSLLVRALLFALARVGVDNRQRQVISEKLLNLRNDLMRMGDDQPWKGE